MMMDNLLHSVKVPATVKPHAFQFARAVSDHINRACPGYAVQAYVELSQGERVIHWIAACPSPAVKEELVTRLRAAPDYAILINS